MAFDDILDDNALNEYVTITKTLKGVLIHSLQK